MNRSIPARLALAATLALAAVPAFAQDHDRGRDAGHREAMHFDRRYHHDHYYPARGYAVAALPRGAFRIGYRGGDYWFNGGVWFRPIGGRYVVVAPPFGVVVPVLPPAYATLNFGGAPYYYANGVYYAPAPGQGYRVVEPPPGAEPDPGDQDYAEAPQGPQPYPGDPSQGPSYQQGPSYPQQPAYPQAPPPPPPPPQARPSEPVVYPRNGQPPQQLEADRTDCLRWATQNSVGGNASVFQRAFGACMDGRGYTVR
jgi:hypothetical protein